MTVDERGLVARMTLDGAPSERSGGNRASGRVLQVLTAMTDGRETYGVSDLSRDLGMTKNMVFRALTTLLRRDFVVRDASGNRYQLGPGVLDLARAGLPDLNLPELARSVIRKMRDLTGETISLAVPRGRYAVTVAGARGRGDVARRLPIGRVIPLHVSPASWAILSGFPDHGIERYLSEPLEQPTPRALTDPEAVWAEIEAVRARGYATVIGDNRRDGRAAAFTIPSGGEFPHGSITVAGPAERFTEARLADLLPQLRTLMDELDSQARLHPSEYLDGGG